MSTPNDSTLTDASNTPDSRVGSDGGFGPLSSADIIAGLEYIALSPAQEHGGFHPNAVRTAQAALGEICRQRAIIGELYAMAIEHCKYRGWSKHPTIDKAHAILWPNNVIRPKCV